MASQADCVGLIRDLVAFPSVSRASNAGLLRYVEDYLGRFAITSEIIWNEERSKGNLWATVGPADRPGVILSGHSDVVPVEDQAWSSDPFALREADGRLYGRGACDMKGFIGTALALVPELKRRKLERPVHFAISYDEELGCTGVWSLVERVKGLVVKPALCIVGEPTSMRAVNGHKGGSFYKVTVEGLAAHSSLAPHAVNAVEHAADLIRFVVTLSAELKEKGASDEDYDVPHSTLSVTTIRGGTASNIIPGECEFEVDLRALPALDAPALIDRIREHAEKAVLPRMRAVSADAKILIEKSVEYPGFDIAPDHPAIAFVNRLLKRNDLAKVAYGTEAGVFSAHGGIVSVVCGPGSIEQAHKPDEFLALSEVDKCRAFLDRLVEALETGDVPW